MDENLVIHAIQWVGAADFKQKYNTYPTKEERDINYKFITGGKPLPEVVPVTMIIRVETETITNEEEENK